MNAIKQLFVVGAILCCSIPAHATKQKEFDKYDPPSDLILTLPDQLLAAKMVSQSSYQNLVTDNGNATQTSALKSPPVNVNCDVDVIQNTLGNVSFSSRMYGKCGLHYHY